jgi:hypothetical protein
MFLAGTSLHPQSQPIDTDRKTQVAMPDDSKAISLSLNPKGLGF